MANKYAVLDIQKLHSFSNLRSQESHNNRDYHMNHVDDNMTCLNREIMSTGGLTYAERWRQIVSDREAKCGHEISVRKNAVYAFDIVTAFSPGAMKELNIDIDDWCNENKKWMCETFGESNIIAMTLHMDETDNLPNHEGIRGPHIHTQVVPLDDRDRLCARSFTGNRMSMKNLQTSYGKAMNVFGLERGDQNSKIKHTDRKRWYKTVAGLVNKQAPRIKDGETMEEYLARLDESFQDVVIAAAKEVEKYRERFDRSENRQKELFKEYAWSINLQHILEESYGGDLTQVNERLKQYQLLEKAVPRKNLAVMIDKMLEKYPPENNLAFFRALKKKRHAKWESLDVDENTADSTSTSSQNSIPVFYDEELEEHIANEEALDILSQTEELKNALGETLED